MNESDTDLIILILFKGILKDQPTSMDVSHAVLIWLLNF